MPPQSKTEAIKAAYITGLFEWFRPHLVSAIDGQKGHSYILSAKVGSHYEPLLHKIVEWTGLGYLEEYESGGKGTPMWGWRFNNEKEAKEFIALVKPHLLNPDLSEQRFPVL